MTIKALEPGRDQIGGAAIPVRRQASRRESFEAVGLIIGILAVLLVVAAAVGAAPPG